MAAKTLVKMTESTPANIIYKEPQSHEWESTRNVECVCGALRYGVEETCGCGATWQNIAGYRIFKDEEKLLTSKRAVKFRVWYHSTTREDWGHRIKFADAPVHLGNKQTAIERAIDGSNFHGNKEYFLYKVMLKPFASISDTVCPDLVNDWSPTGMNFRMNNRGADFVRYVNSYENAGTVSLYGDPNKFIILGCTVEKV